MSRTELEAPSAAVSAAAAVLTEPTEPKPPALNVRAAQTTGARRRRPRADRVSDRARRAARLLDDHAPGAGVQRSARRFYERMGFAQDGENKLEDRGAYTLHELKYRRALGQRG